MAVSSRLRVSVWVAVIGAIVLYVFFITLASISPAQVAGVSAIIAALTTLLIVRNWRVASELADRGGDASLRLARNQARERRGF
jgi:hypothetical protein